MERVSLKRMRSEESPYTLQTKMHVNEKIVNLHDQNKMKQIHDKTTKLLFQAARSISNNNNNNALADRNNNSNNNKKIPLSCLVVLYGNGQIETAKGAEEFDEEFLWVRRKAKCCDRNTYVQSDCTNCQKPLCEDCGYSCSECGQFICNSCVTIFGSGDADHPLCEKCSLFA